MQEECGTGSQCRQACDGRARVVWLGFARALHCTRSRRHARSIVWGGMHAALRGVSERRAQRQGAPVRRR